MKRFFALLLSLCLLFLLCAFFASCNKKKNQLLTYEKDGTKLTFSSNLYQLVASYEKADLVESDASIGGNGATSDAFWDYFDKFDGETVETLASHYAKRILENCKIYLAAHALFTERGLTLPESLLKSLEDAIDELIEIDAGGSKAKFNSILADYGVNRDQLLEFYRMKEEIELLKESLYGEDASLVGKNLKDEYLSEHYLHLHLLRIDPWHYTYETDQNGDEIYYESDSDRVAYDKTNGIKTMESDGSLTYRLPDEDGHPTVRYAYDKENGKRVLAIDQNGEDYLAVSLTEEELVAFKARVAEFASIQDQAAFDRVFEEESNALAEDPQKSGYAREAYLPADSSFASILGEIIDALLGMEAGEVALLSDENGSYYLFCKEEPVSGAYADDDLAIWFSRFSSGLVENLLEEACRALFDYITVNEEILAGLPSMKEIKPNYYY